MDGDKGPTGSQGKRVSCDRLHSGSCSSICISFHLCIADHLLLTIFTKQFAYCYNKVLQSYKLVMTVLPPKNSTFVPLNSYH